MQATKFTVTVEVEVLSLDAAPALIIEVARLVDNENPTGALLKSDGDYVKWSTKRDRVDF